VAAGRARALRDLLLEAVGGCPAELLEQLGALGSWNGIVALWEGGWLGPERASVRATCAQIRVRLRAIARARHSAADVLGLAAGTVVCVEGTIVATSPEDLVVDDGSGELAYARSENARWLSPRLAPLPGDRVTLLGFADSEVDATRAPASPRALPRRVVIRAAGLPLVAHLGKAEP
jgi:hypothetical protein